jgi:hypothetical protein
MKMSGNKNILDRTAASQINNHKSTNVNRLIAVLLLLAVCFVGHGQNREKDRASILLDLKKARATYEIARQQLENDTRLYEEKAISSNEYSKSKNALLSSEVDYQKLILQLISQQSYVIIERAVKYQTATGERRIKIQNS